MNLSVTKTLTTSVSRRRFLAQSALTGLAMSVSGCGLSRVSGEADSESDKGDQIFSAANRLSDSGRVDLVSSVKTKAAGHQLLHLHQASDLLPSHWRGHQVAVSPDRRYLVSVARRPGRQLLIQDRQTKTHQFLEAEPGRHFYGHGIFSDDGSLFYCTENDYENARGCIGVYIVDQGFSRKEEWSSFGTGPHQLAWLRHQGQTLMVVANGGIETHPDYPRIKLNLDSMAPNISYLTDEGVLFDQAWPGHHQLSLRHLDTSADGRVWIGAQYQGEVYESPELVFHHAPGEESLTTVTATPSLWTDLKAYIASVSCHPREDTVCVTAPRDNRIILWQRSTGRMIREMALADCAGVCAHPEWPLYYVSSGEGSLAAFDARNGDRLWLQHFEGIHWDNHLNWAG